MSEQSRRGPRPGGSRSGRPRHGADPLAGRRARHTDLVARRLAARPDVTYPDDLPVAARKDDIAAALAAHQVIVVAGETGSGKTTQLPKVCLELERGIEGMIGHTQPRRIAARSVAERLAEELGVGLGGAVGYQVRFTDHTSEDTLVKVMTDGVLLAELHRDPDLRRYDTLIVDEAHERSLTIDFLLGYLKQLLPRRPDLKVVITSATIDPYRFAAHFATEGHPVPVVEVSGRTYPVEVRYRPLLGQTRDEDRDQATGVCEAVEELWTERSAGGSSDILVFLSGEREIRDTAEALRAMSLPGTEILPLYGRLSAAEQHRVFGAHQARRVVLATNVAETSLTVPGIRYVVDAGTARVSRYSQRTKVQRLPIEPISQASARQRAGRCGRLSDGVCIRLYAEADLQSRPEFTDPEILRTNLASVILAMASLGLGDIARFPFLDPPEHRQIADGIRLLEELQALEPAVGGARGRLTAYGRRMAGLPLDPRLARMVLEADRCGSLAEVLVIVAALSIQDPRERPSDAQQAAEQKHRRFADEHSDFLSLLNLWRYLQDQQKTLSGSAFRRMCRTEYLHYLRIREWQDLHSQLRSAARSSGLQPANAPAAPEQVHEALLSGLLSHVGLRDPEKRDYLGARGARFAIAPGSVLFHKQPQWVVSAELVETTRLWARVNARTHPAVVERLAEHLVKRSYSEPHWEKKRAEAVALERVTLYGVPLVTGRRVGYAGIDPEESRELFLREALVAGEWDSHHRFFHDNQRLVAQLSELEDRARRRDVLVDDETLVAFYDRSIPRTVVSGATFDAWWRSACRTTPELLSFTPELLVSADAEIAGEDDYPSVWRQDVLDLPLSYQFEPGAAADGVTVHIPVEVLNRVTEGGFDWQVPGLREDLASALVRSLPKPTRRQLVPAPDRARAALAVADPGAGPMTAELARALRTLTGVVVEDDEWDLDRVPPHLRVTFRVEDGGAVLGESKQLAELKERLAPQQRSRLRAAATSIERSGLRAWDVGDIPHSFERQLGSEWVQGFPALVDQGDAVALQVLASADEARSTHRLGVRRLLLLDTVPPWKQVLAGLGNEDKLVLSHGPDANVAELLRDVLAAAVDAIRERTAGAEVRTGEQFAAALAAVRRQVPEEVTALVGRLLPVLSLYREAEVALGSLTAPQAAPLRTDVSRQLRGLVHPGFVSETGAARLSALERYLRGILLRLDKAPEDLARDAERAAVITRAEAAYADRLARLPAAQRAREDVRALRWMLEELRVSLFAQRLGTAYPVSEKRFTRALEALAR